MSSLLRAGLSMGCMIGLVVLAGCGEAPPHKIGGKVLLDNAPAANVELSFYPPGSSYPTFTISSKEDGTFEAVIPVAAKTAEGTYSVTAAKYELKKGTKASISEGMDMAQLAMTGQAINILPRKYTAPGSTPLKYEVKLPKCEAELKIASK